MAATIKMSDIAERAGVSRATVSYVFNGRHSQRLSKETQQRVLDAAAALGYRRNELARAVVTGRSHVIGVLTYDNAFVNISHSVAGALDEAATHGYSAKLIHVPFYGSEEKIREVIGRCTAWQLDGAVAVTLRDEAMSRLDEEMQSTGKSVVYIETKPDEDALFVCSDDEDAMRRGIEHLMALGHQRIAFLSGTKSSPVSVGRAAYFEGIMREKRLPFKKSSIAFSAWSEVDVIEQRTRAFLEGADPPTAIICAGERIAFVTMRTARLMGYPVPERLSVLGFGVEQVTLYSDPPLTTLAQPFREMGCVAVRKLLACLEPSLQTPERPQPDRAALNVQLVVRESTAPPRPGE